MDFEFIDESEIQTTRKGRPKGEKKEKKYTLFDSRLEDRTYWGRENGSDENSKIDPGTQLSMALMRNRISFAIRDGYLIDIDDHEISMRLAKEFREELKNHQMEILLEMMSGCPFEIVKDEYNNYIINKELA